MSHSISRWLLVAFWLSILVFGVSEPTQAVSGGVAINSNQLVRVMLISSSVLFTVAVGATLLHRRIMRG